MRHRLVQGLIGIRHVDAALDQPRREILGRPAMAMQAQGPVSRLVPTVRFAAIAPMAIGLPWPDLEIRVVAKNTEGGDDVLAEVLVLVVAPNENEIRVEIVQDLADRPEIVAE